MKKRHPLVPFLFALLLLAGACEGGDFGINNTIRVASGETRDGSLSTVNGSILIGDDCTIRGGCHSVNGRIEIGRDSRVEGLATVNGRIRVDEKVEIDGDLTTVNGDVDIREGSRVNGDLTTVNGEVSLRGTVVDRDIRTVNGDIRLERESLVRGDIRVEGTHGTDTDRRRIAIHVESGSVVDGSIVVEDDAIDVTVYIADDSSVKGEIRNARVVKD